MPPNFDHETNGGNVVPTRLVVSAAVICIVGSFVGYFFLLASYPLIVGPSSAIAFMFGSGIIITKRVFGVEDARIAWGLAPVCGTVLLLFLWLVTTVHTWF